MLSSLKKLIRPDAEVVADAEREASGVALDVWGRHEGTLTRARAAGLDVNTLMQLILLFGPLVVKLVERWLDKQGK